MFFSEIIFPLIVVGVVVFIFCPLLSYGLFLLLNRRAYTEYFKVLDMIDKNNIPCDENFTVFSQSLIYVIIKEKMIFEEKDGKLNITKVYSVIDPYSLFLIERKTDKKLNIFNWRK